MQRVETERLSHPKVDAPCFLFTEVCEGLRWPWLDYDEAGGEGARGLWAVAQCRIMLILFISKLRHKQSLSGKKESGILFTETHFFHLGVGNSALP